jgi:hypothetical protein
MKKKKQHFPSKSNKQELVTKSQVKQMLLSAQQNLLKYSDSLIFSGTVGNVNTITALTLPSTGAGESSMSGNSIDFKSIELRYLIRDTVAVSNDSYAVRLILIENIGNGVETVAEVIQNTGFGNNIVSPYRYDTYGKTFRVHDDWTTWVDSYNTNSVRQRRLFARTRARYDGLSATWSTGQLYLVTCISAQAASDVTVTAWFRLNWTDV